MNIVLNDNGSFHTFEKANQKLLKNDFIDFLEEIFEESDLLEDHSFLWGDYQIASNLDQIGMPSRTIVPMVGLNFEKQLFYNIGFRVSAGNSWWEEEIVLVRSPEAEFTELFRTQYWSAGLGLIFHLNVNDSIDPYFGYAFSYRLLYTACDCMSELRQSYTHDFLA
ncbi:MAG: hypothetical protein AAF806_26355, partial [Bacteroidota bacterium]